MPCNCGKNAKKIQQQIRAAQQTVVKKASSAVLKATRSFGEPVKKTKVSQPGSNTLASRIKQ